MNVAFYNFTKRRNSTRIPTGTGTVKACKLKEDTSVHDPILIIDGGVTLYDYVHIGSWNRYYFVTDIVSLANGLTEYHLTEDVLASNKTAIGATVANIAYASDHYNAFIVDPRIQVSTSKLVQKQVGTSQFASNNYILAAFNSSLWSAAGMCSAYYLTLSDIIAIKDFMCDSNVMSTLGTFFNGNPLSAISYCKWIPYSIPLQIGGINTTTSTHPIIGSEVMTGRNVPEIMEYLRFSNTDKFTWQFQTDFRRVAPFVTALMYLPGVGTVEVNISDFIGSDYIYVETVIEALTGDVTYYIKNQYDTIISTYACNVAADIPIGATIANAQTAGSSAIGTLGGIGASLVGALTGNVALGVGGAATAIASAANMGLACNQKSTTVSSGMGSRGVSKQPAVIFSVYVADTQDPADTNYIATMGRPVGEVHRIDTHSGYVQTIDAHVALNATAEEMDEVNNLLNAGIYYE